MAHKDQFFEFIVDAGKLYNVHKNDHHDEEVKGDYSDER